MNDSNTPATQKRGLVYRSTGSWYVLRDEAGVFRNARIKGRMKIDQEISSTNPIAIGDEVLFDTEQNDSEAGIIRDICPRRNYIVRVAPHNRHQKHIVAANLDQAVVIATIASPRTAQGFIDRFLLTAEAYHIPALIVINKTDLLRPKHEQQLKDWQDMYTAAGYELLPVSAKNEAHTDLLREKLQGKTTLFSGHSGVGKSTLINALIPGLNSRTGAISDFSGKGMHTTTFAEMFDLPGETGRIIDTPGVKEFGLVDLEREELAHYFPEMRSRMHGCRFNNCLHLNEPGCAVRAAVEAGELSVDRYISYAAILDTLEKKWD